MYKYIDIAARLKELDNVIEFLKSVPSGTSDLIETCEEIREWIRRELNSRNPFGASRSYGK